MSRDGKAGLRPDGLGSLIAVGIALIPLPGIQWLTGAALPSALALGSIRREVREDRRLRALVTCAFVFPVGAALLDIATSTEISTAWLSWLLWWPSIAISACVIVWVARTRGMAFAVVGTLPGLMLFDSLTRMEQGNLWKYALSISVLTGVLFVTAKQSGLVKVLAFVPIVAFSAVYSSRGVILMGSVALVVDLTRSVAGSSARLLLLRLGIVGALVPVSFWLAVSGYLGQSIETTTRMQFEGSSAVDITAPRPEALGNLRLVEEDVWRTSLSPSLTLDEIITIRESFRQANRDPGSEYVTNNLLGGIELHSVMADMWFRLGVFGVLFGITIFAFASMGLARAFYSAHRYAGVLAFCCVMLIWQLAFGPASDTRFWPLFLAGLILTTREMRSDEQTAS